MLMEVTRNHMGAATAVDAIFRLQRQRRQQNKQTPDAKPARLVVAAAAWHRKKGNREPPTPHRSGVARGPKPQPPQSWRLQPLHRAQSQVTPRRWLQ